MIKILLPLAVLTLATLYKIYKDYEGDRKKAALDVILLLFLLFMSGFSRYLRIYSPLFFLHISLLIIAWGSYYLYLFEGTRRIYFIFSPLISTLLFFATGFLFGD